MIRKLLATLAVATILFVGCGEDNKLTVGTVIDKEYDDPDSWWSSQCVVWGQNGLCSVSVPQENTDPPKWRIKVEGMADGEQREEWHSIGEAEYNTLDIGDDWSK